MYAIGFIRCIHLWFLHFFIILKWLGFLQWLSFCCVLCFLTNDFSVTIKFVEIFIYKFVAITFVSLCVFVLFFSQSEQYWLYGMTWLSIEMVTYNSVVHEILCSFVSDWLWIKENEVNFWLIVVSFADYLFLFFDIHFGFVSGWYYWFDSYETTRVIKIMEWNARLNIYIYILCILCL